MERINQFLKKQQDIGMLRTLKKNSFRGGGTITIGGKTLFDLSSNDYLNFSTHFKLKEAAKEAVDSYGTGSSASRLLSGDLEIHHKLEEEVAKLKNTESALIFNSGYQANLGIISSLYGRKDAVFSDKLSHASLIDGISLSKATHFRFRHNDFSHLDYLLNKKRKNFKQVLIVTEGVFSMDGDIPDLERLVELKKKYNCKILVDEAHATGIFGKTGSGIIEQQGLAGQIDLIMGTFSKALGSFGAYLGCSEKIKTYLINTCRSFIYSTALAPSVIASNMASLKILKEEPFRRIQLLKMSDFFRNLLKERGFKIKGMSQIVPLIIGDNLKTVDLSQKLKEKGWWALPIRPPTVPKKESRLRFSLTYCHKKNILKRLVDDICELY